ncbi:BadF/BadG/BcrA/BcrD ATPase family protein [Lacimicrobium alkaliphilum]|uniref:ATPase n=1 Tax=Lacimicrobium alkaliphilum TaxID=1526571 RepID=A0ABQ1RHQ8_9ALTE|nr:BadF/BadG/BcrA/BcrD ATPase family protein [Lacimicrobium alkaliphilum]GGD70722.1 ATPase [Lacimicrobium alkaliphilum]
MGSQQQVPLFMGIDGGGSHCRVRIEDAGGNLLGHGRGGPANPVSGVEQCIDSILSATQQALRMAKLDQQCIHQLDVGAGLAGLHLPAMHQAMQGWQHPFASLSLTTDLDVAALGAHQGEDGAVIILGTGFSALARHQGRTTQIGGYGFPINATCSGSWFGLEAIKAVLLDADGIGPATGLTGELLAEISPVMLAQQLQNATPGEFARYAPGVFAQASKGDAVSLQLIEQGADFIQRVIAKLQDTGCQRLAMLGGISPHIRPWLDEACQQQITAAKATAEQGAVLFARQQLTQHMARIQ